MAADKTTPSRIQHLLDSPTSKINLKLSKAKAVVIIPLLALDCDGQDRSLNYILEQILCKHYNVK